VSTASGRGASWILLLPTLLALQGCAASPPEVRSYVVRLQPGQEVGTELAKLAHDEGLQAGSVVSVVGSLTDVSLRFANEPDTTRMQGHFEVVALSGYLADGELHLHMAVSDGDGKTVGGHLMPGNVVYTTLVVAIDEHTRLRYRRVENPKTKTRDLVIEPR